jgi:D-apionolactonase
VRLRDGDPEATVAAAVAAARACGCGLELAVFTDTGSPGELAGLRRALSRAPAGTIGLIRRLLAFSEHEPVTSPGVVAAVREAAGGAAATFGGTNLNFAEINRDRPDPAAADGFAFSANPQVHAADDRSMTEAPASFADMLATARLFLGGGPPLAVTPITLLARFNADAPGAGSAGDGSLPPADHRQASLLCAAFTALAARYLAAGGAASATFYETAGERGVIAGDGGEAPAAAAPPGAAYPVYDVLALLSAWSGRALLSVDSTDPLTAVGLGCRQDGRVRLLVVNATGQDIGVEVTGLAPGPATVRVLDAATVGDWWASGRTAGPLLSGGSATEPGVMDLGPYALALIDATGTA